MTIFSPHDRPCRASHSRGQPTRPQVAGARWCDRSKDEYITSSYSYIHMYILPTTIITTNHHNDELQSCGGVEIASITITSTLTITGWLGAIIYVIN